MISVSFSCDDPVSLLSLLEQCDFFVFLLNFLGAIAAGIGCFLGSVMVPAVRAGAGVVPTAEARRLPVVAAAVVPVGGTVTAFWAGAAAEGQA